MSGQMISGRSFVVHCGKRQPVPDLPIGRIRHDFQRQPRNPSHIRGDAPRLRKRHGRATPDKVPDRRPTLGTHEPTGTLERPQRRSVARDLRMTPGVSRTEIPAQALRKRGPAKLFPFAKNCRNMARRRRLAGAPQNLLLRFHEANRNTTNRKSSASLKGYWHD